MYEYNPQYMTVDVINRMKEYQLQDFFTKAGKRFRFVVKDDTHIIINNGTNLYQLDSRLIGQALISVPLMNMAQIADLPHASYIYGILMDDRIRKDWW